MALTRPGPDDPETTGPSLATFIIIAVGALLAVGAGFYVRPDPKLDQLVQAPVVPAASLTMAPARPAPAPDIAPKAASMSPDKEALARQMAMAAAPEEKTRSLRREVSSERPVAAGASAPPPAPGIPSASAFAPAPPPQSGALATLTALPPGKPAEPAVDPAAMGQAAAKAIRDGDLLTARGILEKSMASGDTTAILALAETYDPVILSTLKIPGAKADSQRARSLYEQAQKAGEKVARKRLAALKKFERRN